jgi:hypothetical protein
VKKHIYIRILIIIIAGSSLLIVTNFDLPGWLSVFLFLTFMTALIHLITSRE